MSALLIKNKRTGAVWEVSEGSPTHKRVMAQPDDYEGVVEPPKKRKAVVE